LLFVQTFIALTAEVMADLLIQFLAQRPILVFPSGVVRFQFGDAGTQFFKLLQQSGVWRVTLT